MRFWLYGCYQDTKTNICFTILHYLSSWLLSCPKTRYVLYCSCLHVLSESLSWPAAQRGWAGVIAVQLALPKGFFFFFYPFPFGGWVVHLSSGLRNSGRVSAELISRELSRKRGVQEIIESLSLTFCQLCIHFPGNNKWILFFLFLNEAYLEAFMIVNNLVQTKKKIWIEWTS